LEGIAVSRFFVILCAVAGLVVAGAGVSNAATDVPQPVSSPVTWKIVGPVHQDPGDDWIPWDRVLHVYNSRQECISAGQAAADASHLTLHCQETKSGAWVLFHD
jgi:hypothetical protein